MLAITAIGCCDLYLRTRQASFGIHVAGAVVVEAGFGIVAASVEVVGVADGGGGDGGVAAVVKGDAAEGAVVVAFDDRAAAVGDGHDVAEVVGVVEVVGRGPVHRQEFVDASAVDVGGLDGARAIALFDDVGAGVIVLRRDG